MVNTLVKIVAKSSLHANLTEREGTLALAPCRSTAPLRTKQSSAWLRGQGRLQEEVVLKSCLICSFFIGRGREGSEGVIRPKSRVKCFNHYWKLNKKNTKETSEGCTGLRRSKPTVHARKATCFFNFLTT